MLFFFRKKGRKTVQTVIKNYGGIAKYYRFGHRTIFSTEGSFGKP